jgi:hypothetical protein
MATNPFASAGLGELGKTPEPSKDGESSFLGDLLAIAAEQSGLKDWLNPTKKTIPGAAVPIVNNNFLPMLPNLSPGVAPLSLQNQTIVNPILGKTQLHPDTLKVWGD